MNSQSRLEPFLYSRKNIAGCIGGLIGIGLLAFGITDVLLGLGIIAGLYVLGYLVAPPERGTGVTLRANMDARDIDSGLRRLLASIYGRVPEDIFNRIGSIANLVVTTLGENGSTRDSSDPNIHLVRQTALSYLPEALNAYLAIPRLYAERRPLANGRTAHDVLLEQLNTMDTKLREVGEDIARNDTDRLMANVRFLQERFASSPIEVPEVQAGTASTPGGPGIL